jgi:hypothetical protein
MEKPRTLQQAMAHFADAQACIDTVASLRWSDGKPTCPACGHKDHYWLAKQNRWKCKECWKQFSVKAGTIFEDSPLSLEKWLLALWMLVNCRAVEPFHLFRYVDEQAFRFNHRDERTSAIQCCAGADFGQAINVYRSDGKGWQSREFLIRFAGSAGGRRFLLLPFPRLLVSVDLSFYFGVWNRQNFPQCTFKIRVLAGLIALVCLAAH